MNLKEIYKPILKDLLKVKLKIKSEISDLKENHKFIRKEIDYFFSKEGKYLRPALFLFSTKSVNGRNKINQDLILLAASLELIHNASLIHDDIIDNEKFRRGGLSLNKKFGDEISMLIGDLVYSKTFFLMVKKIDISILRIMADCVERMCCSEVEELKKNFNTMKDYLKIIKDKTALLFSVCCEIGAMVGGGDKKSIKAMKDYGLNFGFAYQIMDDYLDNDFPFKDKINSVEKVKEYLSLAEENLKSLHDSRFKESLRNLLKYVLYRK